jgi:hypothetical protein
MDVDPNTINLQSGGNYVTAHLEFPAGYDPAETHLETMLLNGTVTPSSDFFEINDWNHNHVPDLAVKFPRDAVEASLGEGEHLQVSITGVIDDTCFAGTTSVRVIRPHLNHPNGGESYLAGVRTLVEWDNPIGWTVSYAQIYYSSDGGDSWSLEADHLRENSFVWAAPEEPTQNGRLRVVLIDDYGVMGYDSSDASFVVTPATTGVGNTVPAIARLYPNSPNPFHEVTHVTFDLPSESQVKLVVLDLSGRVIRVLADGRYPAGTHEMSWNGRNEAGRTLAAGIYFLQMKAGSFLAAKRMYLR